MHYSSFSFIEYNRINARLRIQLKQFQNELDSLEKKLQSLDKSKTITVSECERRSRQLEHLASKKVQMDSRFQNSPASSSRNKLFEASKKNKLFDDDNDDDVPNVIDDATPIEHLRQEHTQILKQQDQGLDNLSKVITRQKHLALRIGNEVESQNDIIDTIAVNMENTADRVNSSTRHVLIVSDQDTTCTYWIVIISLAVAIIIVGLL